MVPGAQPQVCAAASFDMQYFSGCVHAVDTRVVHALQTCTEERASSAQQEQAVPQPAAVQCPQPIKQEPPESQPQAPAPHLADPSEEQRAKGTALYQAGDWQVRVDQPVFLPSSVCRMARSRNVLLTPQGALAAYKAAAAIAPGVAANPANCAAAAMMLRQYKAAAEHARAAIALDARSLRAHCRAGKACLMMGRLDEARAHLAFARPSPLHCA